jgi:hypothetical protein
VNPPLKDTTNSTTGQRAHAWEFVSPEGRTLILKAVGARSRAAQDPAWLRLCAYWVNTSPDRKQTEAPMVLTPYQVINACRGVPPSTRGTGAWLKPYTDRLRIRVQEFERQERVREVDTTFLRDARKMGRRKGEGVHVVTGLPEERYDVIKEPEVWLPARAKKIAKYLRTVPAELYDPEFQDGAEHRYCYRQAKKKDGTNTLDECLRVGRAHSTHRDRLVRRIVISWTESMVISPIGAERRVC